MPASKPSAAELSSGVAVSWKDLVIGVGLIALLAGAWMLHPGLGLMVSGGTVILIGARGLPAGD
jgi:hypothetical protein